MDLVNQELSENGNLYAGQLAQIDGQLGQTGNKLSKLYAALETGRVDVDDLAPRLKQLRATQRELQEKRVAVLDKINSETGQVVDLKAIRAYVSDLQGTLQTASFMERKSFLRSFVSRVDFTPPQVAINYTIPLPLAHGLTSSREVLRIDQSGSRGRIRTYDLAVNSRPLYR